jgi:hypothetical protein
MTPVVVLLVLAAAPGGEEREARKLFRAGERAYEAGQYLGAIRAFEEAYRLTPLPAIAFSLAQACRLQYFADANLRWLQRSADLYRSYIASTPSGARRSDAVSILAEIVPLLERRSAPAAAAAAAPEVTQLMITSPVESASVSIDGGPPRTLPLVIDVEAGPHQITVAADGYLPHQQRAIAIAGRLVAIEAELDPKPARVDLSAVERGVDVYVDGRPAGVTPIAELALAPGDHELFFARTGHLPEVRRLTLERDDRLAVDAKLKVTGQRTAAWVTMGVAAAGLAASVVMTVFAVRADRAADGLHDKGAEVGLTRAEAEEYLFYREARGVRTNAAAILGAAGMGVALLGVGLYFFDEPPGP